MKTSLYSLVMFSILALSSSCREDVDTSALEVYDGPMKMTLNIHLIQSDSAIVRSEIKAPKQLEFANGNLEFPDGIEIQIFEKDGQLSTTLRADRGYLLKQENIFKGVGDVQVHNLIKDQKLQSEELFWEPNKKIIYTEKFVRVQNGGTYSYGSGFEADDTFSTYKLKNPRDGQIELSEDGL
ncbi:LPS export ABC transporter periplasmic protein LptC [Algoriphagus persicinus]|uniref:LPS export ABC transporter periplasmic protein LptC n=1 Tax=Algoriphagus persicinus TaxID=3108754 RepID=UPI002B3FBCDF|nr:LPS export ABC transporter periplasmic protein LptC [Algoriphagus sp. E1-3-M2]MEB2783102.1 LPS export ABC transporter periplasmic protein LptC [Algoriphagus sp. E1-3-M2]